MARAPLPLTVIGGFLGSGKTTLLNRWLHEAEGQRLAVLVNDFGALNVDAQLIAARHGDVVALTNGCVCCQIGDDLGAALIRVLDAPTPVDAVVIEASGVSDPARIGRYGRATPDLVLDGVIVLVDLGAFAAQAADPLLADTLQRQVVGADLLVLNKSDVATPAQARAARERLAAWAPGVPSFETSDAAVPLPLLNSRALHAYGTSSRRVRAIADPVPSEAAPIASTLAPPRIGRPGVLNAGPTPHGDIFDAWSRQPGQTFSSDSLRALLRSMPAGVLRMKGVLRTDTLGTVDLQYAGGRGSLRALAEGSSEAPMLVAIGLTGSLPVAALAAAFEAALSRVDPRPAHPSSDATAGA